MSSLLVCKSAEIKTKAASSRYTKFVTREGEVPWFGNATKIMFSVKNWELAFLSSKSSIEGGNKLCLSDSFFRMIVLRGGSHQYLTFSIRTHWKSDQSLNGDIPHKLFLSHRKDSVSLLKFNKNTHFAYFWLIQNEDISKW